MDQVIEAEDRVRICEASQSPIHSEGLVRQISELIPTIDQAGLGLLFSGVQCESGVGHGPAGRRIIHLHLHHVAGVDVTFFSSEDGPTIHRMLVWRFVGFHLKDVSCRNAMECIHDGEGQRRIHHIHTDPVPSGVEFRAGGNLRCGTEQQRLEEVSNAFLRRFHHDRIIQGRPQGTHLGPNHSERGVPDVELHRLARVLHVVGHGEEPEVLACDIHVEVGESAQFVIHKRHHNVIVIAACRVVDVRLRDQRHEEFVVAVIDLQFRRRRIDVHAQREALRVAESTRTRITTGQSAFQPRIEFSVADGQALKVWREGDGHRAVGRNRSGCRRGFHPSRQSINLKVLRRIAHVHDGVGERRVHGAEFNVSLTEVFQPLQGIAVNQHFEDQVARSGIARLIPQLGLGDDERHQLVFVLVQRLLVELDDALVMQ